MAEAKVVLVRWVSADGHAGLSLRMSYLTDGTTLFTNVRRLASRVLVLNFYPPSTIHHPLCKALASSARRGPSVHRQAICSNFNVVAKIVSYVNNNNCRQKISNHALV